MGLHYEHQLRIGPFDGPNALGLFADLAALRVVASRTFGPVELTASLGALYDWRGAFATSEAAMLDLGELKQGPRQRGKSQTRQVEIDDAAACYLLNAPLCFIHAGELLTLGY